MLSVEEGCDLLQQQLAQVAPLFCEIFVERVARRTPVRTGRLQQSWQAQVGQSSATISNATPYAAFVEYGTPRMAPRGMLRATLLEVDDILAEATARAELTK